MPDGTGQRTNPYYSRDEAARLFRSPEPFCNLQAALGIVHLLKFQTVPDEVQEENRTTGTLRIRLRPEDGKETRLPITFTPGSGIDEVQVLLRAAAQPQPCRSAHRVVFG